MCDRCQICYLTTHCHLCLRLDLSQIIIVSTNLCVCVPNHHCWPTSSWQYLSIIRIIRTGWSASPVYYDDDWHACIDAYCCPYYRASVLCCPDVHQKCMPIVAFAALID